jgi:hypothetical protein
MRTYNARRVLEKAFNALPKIAENMTNKQDVIHDLEAIAKRAGMMAAYLSERHGSGCGDQGHDKALKAMNRTGKIIHMKAIGYNAFHELRF